MVPMAPSQSLSKRLFEAESEESDSDSSEIEGECNVQPAVFNFGWHTLHTAAKAHFNRDVAQCAAKTIPKRPYDNSKREARAGFVRKGDMFKKNGLSSVRISNLLSQDQCLCCLVSVRAIDYVC